MTDTPEKIWMDPDIKFPECEKQYACDVEYTRTDLHLALVAAAKREARNEALREAAASIWRHRKVVPVSFLEAMEANILALMEETDDES